MNCLINNLNCILSTLISNRFEFFSCIFELHYKSSHHPVNGNGTFHHFRCRIPWSPSNSTGIKIVCWRFRKILDISGYINNIRKERHFEFSRDKFVLEHINFNNLQLKSCTYFFILLDFVGFQEVKNVDVRFGQVHKVARSEWHIQKYLGWMSRLPWVM